MRSSTTNRRGFTLVELLVVIAIIATLAAILTPAVMSAITAAKNGAIKLEVTKITQGLEAYKNKHDDYPPDFSDPAIVNRHFRKAFPRMSQQDLNLLAYIINPPNNSFEIDRAEALFLALHGYSTDPTRPLSGPGGPLAGTSFDSSGQVQTLGGSEGMVNGFIEFEEQNIKWALSGTSYISTDGAADDVFPTYVQNYVDSPFVYFDNRTYIYDDPTDGVKVNSFSDPNNSLAGVAQPYKTNQPDPKPTASEAAAWSSLPDGSNPNTLLFANADTFQIVTAGLDGKFSLLGVTEKPAAARVYPIGTNYKTEDNDNITNFGNESTLEGDLP